ncbi:hypothetical protein [Oceanobacillus oncorhynchi]|uniref:hypothetical protein n=1 Tax=Oceanobacillus oncorhynchi TaxID=545501 RepID=UPI0034D63189
MKIKSCIMLFVAVIMLTGCSSNKSDNSSNNKVNNDVPTDISEENHNKLIKEYETYEERVRASDGQHLNNDSDRGFVTDLAELSWEDRKGVENGEESIFTNVETELIDNFTVLYGLKQDEETAFMFTNNTKYDNPVEYAISLEESIIDTLELDKNSITDEIVNGSGLTDNGDTNNEDSTSGTGGTSKPNDEINLDYEPEYLTQEEWDECVQGNVYTLGECIDYDQYYANGDGRIELAEVEENNSDSEQENNTEQSVAEEYSDVLEDMPFDVDENCEEVYSREECEAFIEYYTEGEGQNQPGMNVDWAPGIKEEFEAEILSLDYIDTTEGLQYTYSGYEDHYEVHGYYGGELYYIVTVNVKTGEYHG